MTFKITKKMISAVLSACMVLGAMPVYAEGDAIEVMFTDVTSSDLTTLSGEAKIKVSVKGAAGEVSIAQMALEFDGDLKYKSIRFLQGENNPPKGFQYSPNAALTNSTKELLPSIITSEPITFEDETDLFILTFAGEVGGGVTLRTANLDNTYCIVNNEELKAEAAQSITVEASESANESKTAVIKLIMDKVPYFEAGLEEEGYNGSGLEVKITSQSNEGYTVYTVLNNTLVSQGGHRESDSTAMFTLTNEVLADDLYTVEVSGIGYIPYKVENVSFDEPLEIKNESFIPGDINADGVVDGYDRAACEKAIEDPEYAINLNGAADFDRDGSVNQFDLKIFEGIESITGEAPEKMATPTLSAGKKKISVSWTKPENEEAPIIGYVLKYGTSENSMTSEKKITDPGLSSAEIDNLSDNTKYYVAIAAVNEHGTGEYSDAANATTNKADSESGGGTGGGTGGGNGGGNGGAYGGGGSGSSVSSGSSGGGGGYSGGGAASNPNEPFTDLGNYEWAKASIYSLKNKGYISGTSANEYSPANNIKRGDFMLILTRILKIDNEFSENFDDVATDSYYYNAIGAAKASGIAKGSGNSFMPENTITRQDLITLAYRAFLDAGHISETTDLSSLDGFADKDSISDYAVTAMASMVAAGIIKGSDGNVNPLGNATRAEVAVMCDRLVELM